MKRSAGTMLYRQGPDGLEVLLVHPSGAYNRRTPWSIPKGEVDGDERPEQTARRETLEETGLTAGELVSLGFTIQRGRKRVDCYAGPAPEDASPTTASWEVDQAQFVPIPRAQQLLHPDQVVFIERLLAHLGPTSSPPGSG